MPILQIEYRSVIKFLVLRKTQSEDIIMQLKEAYNDEAPSKATIYRWIAEFKGGRTSVEDEKRDGRPIEIDEKKLDELKEIVISDRRISKEHLCQSLNVSYGSVHNMLKKLGLRKLCSRFVPYFITADMALKRRTCCENNLKLFDEKGDVFLRNIVTEDETPLSLYIPEDRRSSKEWKFPEEKPTKKLKVGTSHRKVLMLTVFWDYYGIIHIDYADNDTKLDSNYYVNVVQITRKKRRKESNQNLYLLHDNAPIHTSGKSQAEIAKLGFTQLSHPPYSPDLAPSDFYLFKHLKGHLKGKKFTNSDDLLNTATTYLESQTPNFFEKAFEDLINRWKKCIEVNGLYIEK